MAKKEREIKYAIIGGLSGLAIANPFFAVISILLEAKIALLISNLLVSPVKLPASLFCPLLISPNECHDPRLFVVSAPICFFLYGALAGYLIARYKK